MARTNLLNSMSTLIFKFWISDFCTSNTLIQELFQRCHCVGLGTAGRSLLCI